ncbi:MAG: choice-of-anchor tandem repeat GloVer-containing protein, partial [Terriglobales bacterium]
TWTESEIYSFKGSPDGAAPKCNLIFVAGNLYGTTIQGGVNNGNEGGDGTVFELTPVSGGGWTETIIHSFGSGADGIIPEAGLMAGIAGNLYGTTVQGGTHGLGTVFELTPASEGWTESVIYSFPGGKSGAGPITGLISDPTGNLYGTTTGGGTQGLGNIFKLTHGAHGKWTESVIHTFTGGRWGANPYGELVFDGMGNLYGMTAVGGTRNWGIAFELTLNSDGKWSESVLHSFAGGQDGRNPYASFIFDGAGSLYGTTALGGGNGTGAVFKLSPFGDQWTEIVVYGFPGNRLNGELPIAGVILDAAGNLYGMTPKGGAHGKGVVYEVAQ